VRPRDRGHPQLAQKYYKLYNFFAGASGALDVWEGVLTLLARELGRRRAADEQRDVQVLSFPI
jgi:hypothetical protein